LTYSQIKGRRGWPPFFAAAVLFLCERFDHADDPFDDNNGEKDSTNTNRDL
jgi:hypothetical protein